MLSLAELAHLVLLRCRNQIKLSDTMSGEEIGLDFDIGIGGGNTELPPTHPKKKGKKQKRGAVGREGMGGEPSEPRCSNRVPRALVTRRSLKRDICPWGGKWYAFVSEVGTPRLTQVEQSNRITCYYAWRGNRARFRYWH